MTPDELKKKLESLNSLPLDERVKLLSDLKDIVKGANSELQEVYQKAQAELNQNTANR